MEHSHAVLEPALGCLVGWERLGICMSLRKALSVMATFHFTCPHCSHTMDLPDTLLGKQEECSACREVVLVTKTNCSEQVVLNRSDTKSRIVELEGSLAEVLFAEDSPAKADGPLKQLWEEQRQLTDRLERTQSILDRLETVLPEVETRQNAHRNATKQLKRVKADIVALHQELGQVAFQGVLAGNIVPSALFEERSALQQRLAELQSQKAEIDEATKGDWKDHLKSKSHYMKVTVQIKVESLKVGGLHKTIGRTLLADGIEETMRCSETSAVLDRVCIKRTEQKDAVEVETATRTDFSDVLQTASAIVQASSFESVASVQAEIKNLKRQLNEISKLLVKNRSAMLEAAHHDQTLMKGAAVGAQLTELADLKRRLEETKPSLSDIAKIASTGWEQISRRRKSVAGVAITLLLVGIVWVWANQEDGGQLEIAASKTNSPEATNSPAEGSPPTPRSPVSPSATQDGTGADVPGNFPPVANFDDPAGPLSDPATEGSQLTPDDVGPDPAIEAERIAAAQRQAERVAVAKREAEKVAAANEVVRVTDAIKKALPFEVPSDRIVNVAFSPDGRRIVTGGTDTTLKVWHAETGEELHTLKGHSKAVTQVAFSPDGNQIVSGSLDTTLKVWDAETGEEVFTLKGHTDAIRSVAFSQDGKLIGSGSSDKTLKLWYAETGKIYVTYPFTVDQLSKEIPGYEKAVTKLRQRPFEGHSDRITCVAFARRLPGTGSSGFQIVSGSSDKTLKIWIGRVKHTLKGHSKTVTSVAVSPDGKLIVSGSADTTLKLWDVKTGKELHTLEGHSGAVRKVAFSPDGKVIGSGDDQRWKVWDVATGNELYSDGGSFVGFTPDGNYIFAVDDKSIRIVADLAKRKAARVAAEAERVAAAKREAERVAAAKWKAEQLAKRERNPTLTAFDKRARDFTVTLKKIKGERMTLGMGVADFRKKFPGVVLKAPTNSNIPKDAGVWFFVETPAHLEYEEVQGSFVNGRLFQLRKTYGAANFARNDPDAFGQPNGDVKKGFLQLIEDIGHAYGMTTVTKTTTTANGESVSHREFPLVHIHMEVQMDRRGKIHVSARKLDIKTTATKPTTETVAERDAAQKPQATRGAASRTSAPPPGKTPKYLEMEKRLFQAKVNGEITVTRYGQLMRRAQATLRREGETSGEYFRRQLQFLVANGTRQESEDAASLLNAINKVNARGGNLNAVSPDMRREVARWLPLVNQK